MTTPRDNSYIGISTSNFREAANFYITHFGYSKVAELDNFISVESPNGKRCLGFGSPNASLGLASQKTNIHLTFLVDDAEEALLHFQTAGLTITRGLDVGTWGARHFVITDPAGVDLFISEGMKSNHTVLPTALNSGR